MTTERVFVVIHATEDGVSLRRETETKLLASLNAGEYGDCPIITVQDLGFNWVDLTERRALYIVAGDLIAPKAKERVTEWTL